MAPSLRDATWVTPVVVISSMPSSPLTTQATSVPRMPNTSAIGSIQALSKAPVNWRLTPAGLERGPRLLKIVRMPSD